MTTTQQDDALINSLINIAWATGSVKSPKEGQQIEDLRAKIFAKPKDGKPEEAGK